MVAQSPPPPCHPGLEIWDRTILPKPHLSFPGHPDSLHPHGSPHLRAGALGPAPAPGEAMQLRALPGCSDRLPPGRRLQARLHPRPLARDCQQISRCITAELAPRLHPGPSGPRPRPRAAPIGRGTRVIKSYTKAYAPPPRPGGCQEPSANYSHKTHKACKIPSWLQGLPPPASSDAPGNGQLRQPFSSSAPP